MELHTFQLLQRFMEFTLLVAITQSNVQYGFVIGFSVCYLRMDLRHLLSSSSSANRSSSGVGERELREETEAASFDRFVAADADALSMSDTRSRFTGFRRALRVEVRPPCHRRLHHHCRWQQTCSMLLSHQTQNSK